MIGGRICAAAAPAPTRRSGAAPRLAGAAALLLGVVASCLIVTLASCAWAAPGPVREIVILHTNDFHSAIDPIEAFWMQGSPRVGGAAHIKTMVEQIRREEAGKGNPVFLFDSGDMFTGMLSRLTYGEILTEMMITMGYDALGIGNHEFDYGSDNFRRQMYRMPFPVLSANTFYRGTDRPFARPHAIIEKDGVRVGVIGIIGRDAMSVVLPSLVTELEFRDPEPYLRASVQELRPLVDVLVVLAHVGKTGPMQSDQEADPEVWRDFDADIELARSVPGIDVYLGGHAHRGIDPPYVVPETGTVIMQTFGHGTRVGVLRLRVDTERHAVLGHEGGLVIPFSGRYPADPLMLRKMQAYKDRYRAEIGTVVGRLQERLTRKYNRESSLGDFVADVIREVGGGEVGLTNAGGLRADLPAGEVTNGQVRDALPFFNSVVTLELTGAQLAEVLEQGLSLERGMIQVSGLRAEYDLQRPVGRRLVRAQVGAEELDPERSYRVSVISFMAEGGDLYRTFVGVPWLADNGRAIGDVVIDWFRRHPEPVPPPVGGRLVRVGEAR